MQKAIDLTRESVEPTKAATDMKDILNRPFIVHSVETAKAKHGEIMYANVSEDETSPQFRVFVRGTKPFERLEWIRKNASFPVEATFIQAGSVWEII